MGVDPGDDTPVVVCDGGPATLLRLVGGVARTAGRVDKTGSRPGRSGASSVTIHPTGCATRQSSPRPADRSVQGHPKGRADQAVKPPETNHAAYSQPHNTAARASSLPLCAQSRNIHHAAVGGRNDTGAGNLARQAAQRYAASTTPDVPICACRGAVSLERCGCVVVHASVTEVGRAARRDVRTW